MKILKRRGSLVVLQDKKGRYWLSRRKKHKHDNRTKRHTKGCRPYFIPIMQLQEDELKLFIQEKRRK